MLGINGVFDSAQFYSSKRSCTDLFQPGNLSIPSRCQSSSYVVSPVLPILPSHVRIGYWTNQTIIYRAPQLIPLPHFVCYDQERCPFLPSNLQIIGLNCLDIRGIGLVNFDQLIQLFRSCLSVDENGNETHCFHPSLFHCPNTSKCISKHRLLDGIIDCYGGADETYTNLCKLNDKHRFQCSSENKCLSPVLIGDGIRHCRSGEDEMPMFKQKLSFQNLCNGYTHLSPVLIDGQNETDETNCEQWPCDNQYTRCDEAWTCPNGADELNCDPTSRCYPDHHECVLPSTFEIICLSANRTGDGTVDCLGATDEREHCRHEHPEQHWMRYQCLNNTLCTTVGCWGKDDCPFEQSVSLVKACQNNPDIYNILFRLIADQNLIGTLKLNYKKYKQFALHYSNRPLLNTTLARLRMVHESLHFPAVHTPSSHADFLIDIADYKRQVYQRWICNRGILIFTGIEKTEYCLCPPSYYGDRCQFQSQRVSLTLKLSKECAPMCRGVYGIVLTLVDYNQVIHSEEQLTYIPTNNCAIKYNLYFLYQSRPKDLAKNYTINIDAYNKTDLTYYTSWTLPIPFLFLPVNRIAAHLIIPAHPSRVLNNCRLVCNDHSHCAIYTNNGEHFCRCDSDWSSYSQCTVRLNDCDCSFDSICLGTVNNRSICLCPLHKSDPRCFLRSVCQNNPCQNGGECVPEDERLLMNNFTCICTTGHSGRTCEVNETRIDISFRYVNIPQSLLIYFITVQSDDDPLITTISKKIAFDQDTATVYTSMTFNLIFVQILAEYYLIFLQVNNTRLPHVTLQINPSQQCSLIHKLLNKQNIAFPLLRQVKYYHVPCRQRPQLSCLCNEDRFANCFPFNFDKKSNCQGRTECENGGQCLRDLSTCPTSTMCICPKCFYGGKCQFTTKEFSLSLDVILSYQLRARVSIVDQPVAIKISIALTVMMLLTGLVSGTLSVLTFHSKKLREVGCGLYLLAFSNVSLLLITVFTLKFWFLLFSRISWITNRNLLWINCISIEFILRSLLAINDWLSACVAIERVFIATKGVSFNKKKSQKTARWIIAGVILCSFASIVYDPLHRQLFDDVEEQRTWCIVRYSSSLKTLDTTLQIFHFIVPFLVNLLSALVIIVSVGRTHSTAHKGKTYKEHLREQFHEQKHLIISPIILVILAVPRLVISFLSGCMKSVRDPWLFLFGYLISFSPSLLTFVVFIWPSEVYKKEFHTIIERLRRVIRQRLYFN